MIEIPRDAWSIQVYGFTGLRLQGNHFEPRFVDAAIEHYKAQDCIGGIEVSRNEIILEADPNTMLRLDLRVSRRRIFSRKAPDQPWTEIHSDDIDRGCPGLPESDAAYIAEYRTYVAEYEAKYVARRDAALAAQNAKQVKVDR